MAQRDAAQAHIAAWDVARATVAAAFGPDWASLPAEQQQQLVKSTFEDWAYSAGLREGLVGIAARPSATRKGVTKRPSVELLTADTEALARSLRPVAARAAQEFDWTLWHSVADEDAEPEKREIESAGQDALTRAQFGRAGPVEQLQIAAPDVAAEAEERAFREGALAQIEAALTALDDASEASERARSLLVRLHLGQRVIIGAPRGLYPTLVYSRSRREFYPPRDRATGRPKDVAFDNFLRYHAGGRARQAAHSGCPTCRLLARFVRVQGMSPQVVSQVMNDFVTFVRTGQS